MHLLLFACEICVRIFFFFFSATVLFFFIFFFYFYFFLLLLLLLFFFFFFGGGVILFFMCAVFACQSSIRVLHKHLPDCPEQMKVLFGQVQMSSMEKWLPKSGQQDVLCGGAVVYWIEPLTLDQRVPGSIPVNAWHFLSFSKILYSHCCSPPRCINGYPVGCERYLLLDVACVKQHLARMLPRELRRGTMSAGLILNPVTGVIIHCKAL